MNAFYDRKLVLGGLAMFFSLVFAMYVSGGAGFIVILPFVLVALSRNQPEKFLFYMLLMISMVVTNPMLAPRGAVFFLEQRIMFVLLGILLTVRIAGRKTMPMVKPLGMMILYLLFMVFPSVMGWSPVVSILKLFLFAVIYYSFYAVSNAAIINQKTSLVPVRSVVLSISIPFIFGSVVLIFFPDIGLMGYEEMKLLSVPGLSLFRGFTNHSQCLGPVASCIGIMLFADLLFGIRKFDKLYFSLLACCPILVWKTASRTALGTMMAGIAFVLFFFMRTRSINRRWKSRVFSAVIMVIAIGSVALLFSGAGEEVKRFVAKHQLSDGEKVELSAEKITETRMGLVENQMVNIRKKPLCGNGFQVSEELSHLDTSRWWSLLSAPVEKGVWVTAVLEEGGVVGFVILLAVLLGALRTLIRYKAYVGASALFVFLVSNFGEFTLFSMSYSGGFCWAMVFAGVVLDSARVRSEMTVRRFQFNAWG